jgi:branched-chain amino acid transport system substrate-binding protein
MIKYDLLRGFVLAAAAAGPAFAGGGVVKIGVLTDKSGRYLNLAGMSSVTAVQMAVDEFGGKVLGMPIEVVSGDHQDKPDVAVSIARQWFDRDGVDMIVDLIDTPVALAVQKLAQERGKIDIVSGAASPELTGAACSPTGFHWTYDSYALGRGTGAAAIEQGDKTWFFITTEAPFGLALEDSAEKFITSTGGKVVGEAHHPVGITDFSPYLQQAQQSGAQAVALVDAGDDAVAVVEQATRYGIGRDGQRLAGLLIFLSDVHSIGLDIAQNMMMTTTFYWDLDDETRAWSERFFAKTHQMPNMVQAGDYSATLHYLQAVEAAGTTDGPAVAEKMHALPVKDAFAREGKVRPDGLMQHDMYLAEVKTPAESKRPWDYLNIIQTIPGNIAFKPLKNSDCPFVKK